MTIATPERYAEMLEAARRGGYAYPAINVTSSQTLNAALKGFADAESDGIIQISVGGAAYVSGRGVNDRVTGSLALAAFAHEVAAKYPNITIALHTDHCAKQYLDEWVRPLLAHEADQVARGQEPTFQSHMWDGSTVPLKENLDIAEELLAKSQKAHTVLEIEIGAVGGEEDGHSAEINEKLYSTPEDGLEVARRLGLGERGRYMAAFTFGNVHGAYKPGVVKLRPSLLGDIQARVARAVAEGELPSAAGIVDFPNGKPFEGNCRGYLQSVIKRARAMGVTDILNQLPLVFKNYIKTDMDISTIAKLVVSFLKLDSSNIILAQTPVFMGVPNVGKTDTFAGYSCVVPDAGSIANLLNQYFCTYTGPIDVSEMNLVTDEWPHGSASTDANVQYMGRIDKESDDAILNGDTDLDGAVTTDGQAAGSAN